MEEGTYFKKDKDSLDGDWQFRDNLDLVTLLHGYSPRDSSRNIFAFIIYMFIVLYFLGV